MAVEKHTYSKGGNFIYSSFELSLKATFSNIHHTTFGEINFVQWLYVPLKNFNAKVSKFIVIKITDYSELFDKQMTKSIKFLCDNFAKQFYNAKFCGLLGIHMLYTHVHVYAWL